MFSALFIIFIFKEFCEKNIKKRYETEIPQNNEKMSQVEAKMEQNSGEISKDITKCRLNCPKNYFLEGLKFDANFGLQKKDKKLKKWGTSPSQRPARLRAGAMGKTSPY